MTHTDLQGLLACPFCGGEANPYGVVRYSRPLEETWWEDGSLVTEAFFVNCISCGIRNGGSIAGGYQTREQAIAAWNQRADLAAKDARIAEASKEGFTRGYLIAVSNLLHQHGAEVEAEDCLAELGETEGVLKRLDFDDFDAKPLRRVFREISRKAKYRAARALHQSPEEKLAARLEKRAAKEREIAESSRVVAELLQPQLDRFDARNPDEPWNTYAVRLQLDHRNSAKRDAELADDLEQAVAFLRAHPTAAGDGG